MAIMIRPNSFFKGRRIPSEFEDDLNPFSGAGSPPAPIVSTSALQGATATTIATSGRLAGKTSGFLREQVFAALRALHHFGMLDKRLIEEHVLIRAIQPRSYQPNAEDLVNLLCAIKWRWNPRAHHMNNVSNTEREVDVWTADDVQEVVEYMMLSVDQAQQFNELVRGQGKKAETAFDTILAGSSIALQRAASLVIEGRGEAEVKAVFTNPLVQPSYEADETARKAQEVERLKHLAEEELRKKALAAAEAARIAAQQAAAERARVEEQARKDQEELDALLLLDERSDNENLGSW